jgi:hypothetical protein
MNEIKQKKHKSKNVHEEQFKRIKGDAAMGTMVNKDGTVEKRKF